MQHANPSGGSYGDGGGGGGHVKPNLVSVQQVESVSLSKFACQKAEVTR